MKKTKFVSLILCVVLICSLLAGCGSSKGNSSARSYAAAPMAMDQAAAEEAGYDTAAGNSLTDSGSTASSALPESRKWIITMYLSAETDDLDALTAALDEKILALNGYVEDQNVYNGSAYSGRRYRNANLTVRIPAEDADKFTEEVSGIANVVSKEKNLEDVTLNYVATESRVQALETEQTRLLELLSQAENMTDLLEIESRLTDVRYELENYTSQLKLYDNQIDYATIHLNITEVQEYTPVEEPSLWERIRDGFQDSLTALGENLQNLLVWLIVALPFLVIYGGIIAVIVVLIKKVRKNRKVKKDKKQTPPATEEK